MQSVMQRIRRQEEDATFLLAEPASGYDPGQKKSRPGSVGWGTWKLCSLHDPPPHVPVYIWPTPVLEIDLFCLYLPEIFSCCLLIVMYFVDSYLNYCSLTPRTQNGADVHIVIALYRHVHARLFFFFFFCLKPNQFPLWS